MNWTITPAAQLTPAQLYAILCLRNQVFIVEQACAYQDIDGADLRDGTFHLCGWRHETLITYARLLGAPAQPDSVKIGRVIVAPSARGQQLGYALMEQALAGCARFFPSCPVSLSAQAHLEGFYARLGFRALSTPYDEDGILHIDMRLER